MKTAIIHEWLTTLAGSEKVLEQILELYPMADLFVIVADPKVILSAEYLRGRKILTSFIQNLPFSRIIYRSYLPLMPLAVEQFDLSGYQLIISSSHAVAKGVLTGPDQLHVSYVHSPIRYAWDLQHQYLSESYPQSSIQGALVRYMLHKMRIWDTRTGNGVDYYVANSRFIARRINKIYRRPAVVIYPPVNIGLFAFHPDKEDYYVTSGRFVSYKRIDLIVNAFSYLPAERLVVVGSGPDFEKIRRNATPNVEFLGFAALPDMVSTIQRARAYIYAAEEDFGIAPVEAQACGTPVIAYGKGGVLETVVGEGDASRTGIFFKEQTVQGVLKGLQEFRELSIPISAAACRKNAERFSESRFQDEFQAFVEQCCRKYFGGFVTDEPSSAEP